jgi:hypothetical protein
MAVDIKKPQRFDSRLMGFTHWSCSDLLSPKSYFYWEVSLLCLIKGGLMLYDELQVWKTFFINLRINKFPEIYPYETNKLKKIKSEGNISKIKKEIKSTYEELKSGNIKSKAIQSGDYPGFSFHAKKAVGDEAHTKFKDDEKNYICQFIHASPEVIRVNPLLMEIVGYDASFGDFFVSHIGEDQKNDKCPKCKENQCTIKIEEGEDLSGRKRASFTAQCECGAKMSEQEIRDLMKEVIDKKKQSTGKPTGEVTDQDIREYLAEKKDIKHGNS